jgi:hypothetical protein
MADKRRARRYQKRLKLRFGADNPIRFGFTEELSATGLFIKTSFIMKSGSIINIEISNHKETTISIEGKVMWAKRVPAQLLTQVKKAGMGIKILKILSGDETYKKLCTLHSKL